MATRHRFVVCGLAGVGIAVVAALLLYRECAFGGGMPGWYRDCDCIGLERLDYDQTAADGKRRTVCIGLVASRTCYQYQDGPVVPCQSIPAE